MTGSELLDFIDRNSLPGEWIEIEKPLNHKLIRHRDTKECPICWVGTLKEVNTYGDTEYTNHIIKRLDLNMTEACRIVDAADSFMLDNKETIEVYLELKRVCKL